MVLDVLLDGAQIHRLLHDIEVVGNVQRHWIHGGHERIGIFVILRVSQSARALARLPSIASVIYSTSSCLRSGLAANPRSREETRAWLGEDGHDTLAPAPNPCIRHAHAAVWNGPIDSARTFNTNTASYDYEDVYFYGEDADVDNRNVAHGTLKAAFGEAVMTEDGLADAFKFHITLAENSDDQYVLSTITNGLNNKYKIYPIIPPVTFVIISVISDDLTPFINGCKISIPKLNRKV